MIGNSVIQVPPLDDPHSCFERCVLTKGIVLYTIESQYRAQFEAQMRSVKLATDIVRQSDKEKAAHHVAMFCKVTESVMHDIRTPAAAIAIGIRILKVKGSAQDTATALQAMETAGASVG